MKSYTYIFCPVLLLLAFFSYGQQDSIPTHETFAIASKQVGETRVINVWTPPEYSISADSLPVMYMADGGINEDFPQVANTLAQLIAAKKIAPLILVGIANTQRRRDLTGPTENEDDKKIAPTVGGSASFRNFIVEELFQEISKRYRIKNERGIIGESLSGLFVVETFFLRPDLFDYYIAFDPSLWWNNKYLIRTADNYLAKMKQLSTKKFWFAGSSAKDISSATRDLSKIIKKQKLATIDWYYADEPKEQHHTIFRSTKEKAILWVLGQKSMVELEVK